MNTYEPPSSMRHRIIKGRKDLQHNQGPWYNCGNLLSRIKDMAEWCPSRFLPARVDRKKCTLPPVLRCLVSARMVMCKCPVGRRPSPFFEVQDANPGRKRAQMWLQGYLGCPSHPLIIQKYFGHGMDVQEKVRRNREDAICELFPLRERDAVMKERNNFEHYK